MRGYKYLVLGSGGSPLRLTIILALPFLLVLFALLMALYIWEFRSHKRDLIAEMTETGRAYFEQLVVTRLWNANHGGVYVEVTEHTQPNPYLSKDPDRDIVSTEGRKYTKMNPAYMMRELSKLAFTRGKYTFRVTSLKPLNPANRPDGWEADQLRKFESGTAVEAVTTVKDAHGETFRYMAPLYVETACLRCHEKQGYEYGDVRGGISIDLDMAVARSVHTAMARRGMVFYIATGLVSFIFAAALAWTFSRRIMEGIRKDVEFQKLRAAIELSGAAAHELRQPLTVIIGLLELMNDKLSRGEPVAKESGIITDQCRRIDDIIARMLKITVYRTKRYTEDVDIFDLGVEPYNKHYDLEDKPETESDSGPGQ